MKYPLMRNNILREDLDAVIEHLKKDDPILTNGPYVRAFEEECGLVSRKELEQTTTVKLKRKILGD